MDESGRLLSHDAPPNPIFVAKKPRDAKQRLRCPTPLSCRRSTHDPAPYARRSRANRRPRCTTPLPLAGEGRARAKRGAGRGPPQIQPLPQTPSHVLIPQADLSGRPHSPPEPSLASQRPKAVRVWVRTQLGTALGWFVRGSEPTWEPPRGGSCMGQNPPRNRPGVVRVWVRTHLGTAPGWFVCGSEPTSEPPWGGSCVGLNPGMNRFGAV